MVWGAAVEFPGSPSGTSALWLEGGCGKGIGDGDTGGLEVGDGLSDGFGGDAAGE